MPTVATHASFPTSLNSPHDRLGLTWTGTQQRVFLTCSNSADLFSWGTVVRRWVLGFSCIYENAHTVLFGDCRSKEKQRFQQRSLISVYLHANQGLEMVLEQMSMRMMQWGSWLSLGQLRFLLDDPFSFQNWMFKKNMECCVFPNYNSNEGRKLYQLIKSGNVRVWPSVANGLGVRRKHSFKKY